jgi:hypothetical protein
MALDGTFDNTAIETIDLLEARLRRIECAVCGQSHETPTLISNTSAVKRLAGLEHALHQLASKSKVIQDLINLHAKYPDLFQSISPKDLPTTLDTSSILSIVLASASLYPSTASRLTSILDVPIPPAEASTQLIDLQPRIAKVETLQAAQNADIAALRQRSAEILQRWYSVGILCTGDSWVELEGRVEQVEQRVRRVAITKRLDDDMI